jgi:hypothetical protein
LRLILLISLSLSTAVYSQLSTSCALETGNNVVDRNSYGASLLLVRYQINKYQLEAGSSEKFSNQKDNLTNGYFLYAGRNFQIKNISFRLSAKYIMNPTTSIIRDQNIGIYTGFSLHHFDILLGNNYRIYGLSRKYRKENDFGFSNASVKEPVNLIYDFTYRLMDMDHKWNLRGSVTNLDYFIVHQETNPMLKLNFTISFNDRLNLFSDLYYIRAGFMNIRVIYYGYLIRAGIQWKIK